MDIRKLQRAIVDGLEDVKAQNILVFNTEHLSPLFERVILASGQSNRQTKALAASIRDAVKAAGMSVLRTEGEENGEWIIVDCGAAVAHVMQPSIRDYYRLEEIWGGKPVKIKLGGSANGGLVKASEDDADVEDDETVSSGRVRAATADDDKPARKAASKTAVARKTSSASAARADGMDEQAPARKPAAKKAAGKTAGKATPRAAAGKSTSTRTPATRSPAAKTAAAKSAKAPARKTATQRDAAAAKPATRSAAGKTSATSRATRAGSTAAPAKAAVKKIVVPATSSRNAASGAKAAAKKAPAKPRAAAKTASRTTSARPAAAKKTSKPGTRRG